MKIVITENQKKLIFNLYKIKNRINENSRVTKYYPEKNIFLTNNSTTIQIPAGTEFHVATNGAQTVDSSKNNFFVDFSCKKYNGGNHFYDHYKNKTFKADTDVINTFYNKFCKTDNKTSNCVKGNCISGYGEKNYTDKNGKPYSYKGIWSNSQPNGYGIFSKQNGTYYNGYFVNGKYEGYGKLYDSDSSITYEGQFTQNKKNGYGKQYFGNGSKYFGNFSSNKFNGYGEFTNMHNNVYKGNWVNGFLDGKNYTDLHGPQDKKIDQKNIKTNENSYVKMIKKLQWSLLNLGYTDFLIDSNNEECKSDYNLCDGVKGNETKKALEKFQLDNPPLVADKILGKKTKTLINQKLKDQGITTEDIF